MQCLTSARGRLRSLVANCTEEELAELRTDVEEQSSVGQALQALMANNVTLQELMARYQKEASESKDLANKVRRAGIPRLVWRRDSLMHPHSEFVFTLQRTSSSCLCSAELICIFNARLQLHSRPSARYAPSKPAR